VSISLRPKATAGVYFPLPIMELELNPSTPSEFLGSLSGFTAATNIRVAASAWRSANAWWSSMGAASGSIDPLPAEDPPSPSRFPSAPDTTHQQKSGPAGPRPRLVLLLEDNPVDVFVITEVLESLGLDFQLRIACDGGEALAYLQDLDQNPSIPIPSLLLLDLNVPKVDGIEVLRRLRDGSRCNRMPVVIVTSSTAEPDRAAARRLGVDAYFEKSNDLMAYMELAEVIRRILHVPGENKPA